MKADSPWITGPRRGLPWRKPTAWSAAMEQILNSVPEVESTSRRTGLELGLAAVTEANRGDILVKLKKDRSRGIDDVMEDVRAKVTAQEPAVRVEFVQVLQDMIGDLTSEPEPIQIKLFSPGPGTAGELGAESRRGHRQDSRAWSMCSTELKTPSADRPSLFRSIPAWQPAPASRRKRSPPTPPPFWKANRQPRPWSATTGPTSCESASLRQPGFARGHQRHPADQQHRENRDAGIAGHGYSSSRRKPKSVARICSATCLSPRGWKAPTWAARSRRCRRRWPGCICRPTFAWSMAAPTSRSRNHFAIWCSCWLWPSFLFSSFCFSNFGSFAAPLAILASALLSTSGVFLALILTRTTFNVSSFMGMIMVVGIVAKNGILLLDADQKFRRLGLSAEDAMLQASRRRLRPIVMTALATCRRHAAPGFCIWAQVRKCFNLWPSQSSAGF